MCEPCYTSGMRHAIQLPDKTFAAFQFKSGTNKNYLMPVSESVDAHDFGSEDKAEAWLRGRRLFCVALSGTLSTFAMAAMA